MLELNLKMNRIQWPFAFNFVGFATKYTEPTIHFNGLQERIFVHLKLVVSFWLILA